MNGEWTLIAPLLVAVFKCYYSQYIWCRRQAPWVAKQILWSQNVHCPGQANKNCKNLHAAMRAIYSTDKVGYVESTS